MQRSKVVRIAFTGLWVLWAVCRPVMGIEPGRQLPPDLPYAPCDIAAEGSRAYRVEPSGSQLVIHVYPEGWLSPILGRRHIISTTQLHGRILLPVRGPACASVHLSVQDLEVNDPSLRAEAGLKYEMSDEENAATRRRMLAEILEADRFPFIRLRIEDSNTNRLPAALTLHGTTRRLQVPAMLQLTPEVISAEGSFRIRQTDFGIKPYSVLAGTLRVADRLDIFFRIRATRLASDPDR